MAKRTTKSKKMRLTLRQLYQKIEALVNENKLLKRHMRKLEDEQSPKI